MLKDQDLFDFSGYPKEHPCFASKNKKVIGKMKDELNGLIMKEFVGLRAKTYSVSYRSHEMKKAKGCLLYTSPSPRDKRQSRMPSSA